MAEQFDYIDIALIDEDVDNHRLVTDQAADEQLQASIRANGVQQPVKVNQKDDGRYTLVFGFRRKANALMAGLSQIPALIVKGLSPQEIRALQAIENLERKELHPLEEARFCEDLAETIRSEHDKKNTGAELDLIEAISQRIGRSKTWVDKRLAMSRLSDRVKQAFIDGDIYLQHVHLIARLAGHEPQEEVLGMVAARECHWLNGRERTESKTPPKTIGETRRAVEARLQDLSTVPWKLDAEFDGKPACSNCPHNSANRMDLFSDDQPKKPKCLEASCYKEKNKIASRAVQKATNTALKTSDKPTAKHVTAAIAEREVDFVQPKAVTEATKRRQEPTKQTSSENRGGAQRDKEQKIFQELQQRGTDWDSKALEQLNDAIPLAEPAGVAIMLLIRECPPLQQIAHPNPTGVKARHLIEEAVIKLAALTNGTISPAEALSSVSDLLFKDACKKPYTDKEDPRGEHPMGFDDYGLDVDGYEFLAQCTAKAFSVDIGTRPNRKEIEAELYPEKPKAKAPAKSKKAA